MGAPALHYEMLIGMYNYSIDAKGRLFIPAKWRDDLGSTFISNARDRKLPDWYVP